MMPEQQPQQQLTQEQRLDRIEATLRRICAELDLAINGIQHLLVAVGSRAAAESMIDELESLHQERSEADADTLPPEAS